MFHHHKKHHNHDNEEVVATAVTTATTQDSACVGGTCAPLPAGAHIEKHKNAAALAEEKVHHKEAVHVTPVVTRDVEKTEVRQVVQPVHETQVLPTQVHEKVLPEQRIEKNMATPIPAQVLPTPKRVEVGTESHTVQHAAVVQERVHKKIIEDVQPIVYRDVIQEHHVNVQQPIHEHIVEPAVVTHCTAPVIESTGLVSGVAPTHLTGTTYPVGTMHHGATSTMGVPTAGSTLMHQGGTGGMIHQKFQGETMPSARPLAGTGLAGAAAPLVPTGTGLHGGKHMGLEQQVGNMTLNERQAK